MRSPNVNKRCCSYVATTAIVTVGLITWVPTCRVLYVAVTATVHVCLIIRVPACRGCTSLWLLLYSVSYYVSTGMQGSVRRCDCYCTWVSQYLSTGVQGLYIATTSTVTLCLIIWVLACTSHYMSTGMQGSARRYDWYWTLSLIRWVPSCRSLYVAVTATVLCLLLHEYRHAGVCTSLRLLLYLCV